MRIDGEDINEDKIDAWEGEEQQWTCKNRMRISLSRCVRHPGWHLLLVFGKLFGVEAFMVRQRQPSSTNSANHDPLSQDFLNLRFEPQISTTSTSSPQSTGQSKLRSPSPIFFSSTSVTQFSVIPAFYLRSLPPKYYSFPWVQDVKSSEIYFRALKRLFLVQRK